MTFSNVIDIVLTFILGQIILLPLTAILIEQDTIESQDWISFYGSILGGIIGGIATIIAIVATINYYEKQNSRNATILNNRPIVNKIDEILNQIADRNTISSSLYMYVDELKEIHHIINGYNSLQGQLLAYFTNEGIKHLAGFYGYDFFSEHEEGKSIYEIYYKLPYHIIEKGKSVGHYSLYENAEAMLRGDAELGRIIDFEKGGSGTFWASFIYVKHYANEPEYIDMRTEFIELVPKLVVDLERIKRKLSI